MQMYPKDGSYKEHYHAEVEEDSVFEDDCNYNRGSSMQMMKPDRSKLNYDQNHGYGGHNDQFKHNYGQNHGYGGHDDQLKHNYDQYRGYGGLNDLHKDGRESYSVQYSEASYEEERNDYSGHGGKNHNAPRKHNAGYGAREGYHGPHKEHQYQFSQCFEETKKGVPVGVFKGIRD